MRPAIPIRKFARLFIPGERWLDRAIWVMVALILITAAVFGAFYLASRYRMAKKTVVYEAGEKLAEQVRKNPLDIEARVALGRSYLARGLYDKAIDQFKEALKIDEEHQGAIVFMGIAYMGKGDYDKALKQFETEIRLYEKAGFAKENRWLEQAYYNKGVILFKQKKYDDAVIYVRKALGIRRTDADSHFLLGRIFLEKGAYDDAITEFRQCLRFDPKFADAHYGMGLAYEKKELKDEAIAAYKKAIEVAKEEGQDFKEAKRALNRLQ